MRPLLFSLGAASTACAGTPDRSSVRPGAAGPALTASLPATATQEALPVGPPVIVPQLFLPLRTIPTLSPNGQVLAMHTETGLQIVDAGTGVVRGVHEGCVAMVAISSDARNVVFTDCDTRALHRWDLRRGSVSTVVSTSHGGLTASAGGKVAVTTGPSEFGLVDISAGDEKERSVPSGEGIGAVSLADDGTLVIASRSRKALIYGRTAEQPITIAFPALKQAIISASGARVVLAANDGPARVVDSNGKTLAEGKVCEGVISDLGWTADATHLIVSCWQNKRASVVSYTPALVRERVLIESSGSSFSTWTGPRRVGVRNFELGFSVFDTETGELLRHVDGKTTQVAVDAALDRFLLQWASSDDAALYDVKSGRMPWALRANVNLVRMDDAASGALSISSGRSARVFDTASHSFAESGYLGPDGKTSFSVDASGEKVTLLDRLSGKSVSFPGRHFDRYAIELTRHGKRLLVFEPSPVDGDDPPSLLIFERDGPSRRIDVLPFAMTPVPSPNEDLVALVAGTDILPQHRCASEPTPACIALETYDLAHGNRVARLKLVTPMPEKPDVRFTPDGRQVFMGGAFYGARSGDLAWRLAEGSHLAGFDEPKNLAFVSSSGGTSVVAIDTRKEVSHLERIDAIHGSSDDGHYVVASVEGRLRLVDMATSTVKPLDASAPPASDRAYVTADGGFVWYIESPFLVALRVADHRALRWAGEAAPITDEGVFDPADLARLPYAVRRGPSVVASPMATLGTAVGEFGHPRLVEDFFAGRPVAKAP